ncbi:hypothetical protein [Oricola nitratireducens]|uniref:hypothetical protein n=1 Tax=Oricola nitratireducens TaxID=2775868 RepID=UPI001869522F|nr:hypothetical protein [Oricola nitratireducens]
MTKLIVRKPGNNGRKSAIAVAAARDKAGLQAGAAFAGAAMALTLFVITAVLLTRA